MHPNLTYSNVGDGHPNRPSIEASQAKIEADRTLVNEIISIIRSDAVLLTRESPVPNSTEKRQPVFRFERGQILAVYKLLRKKIAEAKKKGEDCVKEKLLLKKFRAGVQGLEKDLDEINRQLYTVDQFVEIDDDQIGKHKVPVVKFDLRDPESKEPDTRIPWVLCGTFMSDVEHNVEFAMALALKGEKVYAIPYPERTNVEIPSDWKDRLKKDRTLKPHATYMKRAIEGMGLPEVNIMGYSMGGAVALELGADAEMKGKIGDLVSFDPVGFEQKSMPGIAFDFARHGVWQVLFDTEAKAKSFVEPKDEKHPVRGDLQLPVVNILRGRQFTPEKLAAIKPKGKFQVWLGDKSLVSAPDKTVQMFIESQKDGNEGNSVQISHIRDEGHDGPSVETLGIVEKLIDSSKSGSSLDGNSSAKAPGVHEDWFDARDLQNSAAQLVLEKIMERAIS